MNSDGLRPYKPLKLNSIRKQEFYFLIHATGFFLPFSTICNCRWNNALDSGPLALKSLVFTLNWVSVFLTIINVFKLQEILGFHQIDDTKSQLQRARARDSLQKDLSYKIPSLVFRISLLSWLPTQNYRKKKASGLTGGVTGRPEVN